MKRKIIPTVSTVVSVLLLAACAPAALTPAPLSPSDLVATQEAQTTGTNTTLPTVSNETDAVDTSGLACGHGQTSASVTPELTEGPYYKVGSPELANLIQTGITGTKLVITGYVYDTDCQPVANAWLDFWQADANGVYDNSGYTLRGHQYTDANGKYELTTVVPGLYPGRTEHIHLKVQAPNGQIITSQWFFPDVSQNDSDGIYLESMLLPVQETADGLQAQFNFVVP